MYIRNFEDQLLDSPAFPGSRGHSPHHKSRSGGFANPLHVGLKQVAGFDYTEVDPLESETRKLDALVTYRR